jgi:hypothetical protein
MTEEVPLDKVTEPIVSLPPIRRVPPPIVIEALSEMALLVRVSKVPPGREKFPEDMETEACNVPA